MTNLFSAGARVLGGTYVDSRVNIGANAVVIEDTPARATKWPHPQK